MNNKTAIALITSLAIVTSIVLHNNLKSEEGIPNEVITAFNSWKRSEKRLYGTPEEEMHRLRVFYENYKKIQEVNSANLTYKFGLNTFADLTEEEFAAKYLMPAQPAETFKMEGAEISPISSLKQKPTESWDWSQRGCATGIYTQGNCASGYAIATAKSLSYGYFCNGGPSIQTSPQELIDCSRSFGNTGCSGGTTTNSFQYVYDNGLSYETAYRYTGSETGYCKGSSPGQYRISNYYMVHRNTQSDIMQAVKQQPVTAAVDASTWQFYSGGVFYENGCSQDKITHFVTVVGYGYDIYRGPFWKLENSWGTVWGEAGYMRIIRSDVNNAVPCGLPSNVFYPVF